MKYIYILYFCINGRRNTLYTFGSEKRATKIKEKLETFIKETDFSEYSVFEEQNEEIKQFMCVVNSYSDEYDSIEEILANSYLDIVEDELH